MIDNDDDYLFLLMWFTMAGDCVDQATLGILMTFQLAPRQRAIQGIDARRHDVTIDICT